MAADPRQMRINPAVLAGAVPLDPKPAAPPPSARAAGDPGSAASVIDVTDATFEIEVLQRSMTVPVVLDLWATWCGPCKTLSPILERLAQADGGSWVLAKVDVDANPQLSAALRVQSIPTVFGVVGGQLVPMFQGALPERQVRQYLESLLALAREQGLPGPAAGHDEAGPGEPEPAEELTEGDAALARGDLEAARAAYGRLLERDPASQEAAEALARVTLVQRARAVDVAALRERLAADPDDVEAACGLADVAVVNGHVEAALDSLIELVRRTSGKERNAAREHLLGLFAALSDADPRVLPARRKLASALF